MSHFVEVKTVFKDERALVEALEDAFGKGTVELSPEGTAIYGYGGDDRSKLAPTDGHYAPLCHVVVRRRYLHSASNDIGYRRGTDGLFRAYISDFDKSYEGVAPKIKAIPQRYAVAVATKQAKLSGFTVKEEQAKDGRVKLVLSKWGA